MLAAHGVGVLTEASSEVMIERCVVVQRQSDGYGFTVTGDHPVFVHTVKPEGAAFCAGVREGDRILKVSAKYSLVVKFPLE
uniref:PDZ domain-containing protein n=1 Tax=Angiostrongylus cantonensis TaxID=6313 RepID=A0A0K0DRH9_ANGCA